MKKENSSIPSFCCDSRSTLQNLVAFGRMQQEELLLKQEQIQDAHNRLFQNSQSILASQARFL